MRALQILEEARSREEIRYALRKLDAMRKAAGRPYRDPRPNICPACSSGIHKRAFEHLNQTLLVCPDCGWNQLVDGLEGKLPGETYIPKAKYRQVFVSPNFVKSLKR